MEQGGLISKNILVVLAAMFISAVLPDSAWALQSHGSPEGLYVHQMAHVHCFLALGYLCWDIRRSSFPGKGWRYLQLFCLLMLGWNSVAFMGHWEAIHIAPDMVSATGYLHGKIHAPLTLNKIIFYITKFDHFIAVPALFFLYMGMRTLYRSVEKSEGEAGNE